jgi:hypothetical protein
MIDLLGRALPSRLAGFVIDLGQWRRIVRIAPAIVKAPAAGALD